MTTDLILHYAPDNASLCVRLLLEELDVPYQTTLVDRANKGQRAPAYLRLNPNGLIPTLETPNGPLFETAAILLWLADQHTGQAFPDVADTKRGAALTRLFWLANTVHPALRMLFYPAQYCKNEPDALRAQTRGRLIELYDQIDADAVHLDTAAPNAIGCYLAPMLRWSALYGGDSDWFHLARWPALQRFAQGFEVRPAVARAARAEGLGPTPFSAPSFPNPPEGSAL